MAVRSSEAEERDRLCSQAYSRARQRLVERHREEVRVLFNEERAKVGLPPVEPGWDGALTTTQTEILSLAREGMRISEIARHRGVSKQMVHQTLRRAERKVGSA